MDKIMQKKYDDIIYHANRIDLNGPQFLIDLIDSLISDEEIRYIGLLFRIECKLVKYIDLLGTDNVNSKKIVKKELERYLIMIRESIKVNEKGGEIDG